MWCTVGHLSMETAAKDDEYPLPKSPQHVPERNKNTCLEIWCTSDDNNNTPTVSGDAIDVTNLPMQHCTCANKKHNTKNVSWTCYVFTRLAALHTQMKDLVTFSGIGQVSAQNIHHTLITIMTLVGIMPENVDGGSDSNGVLYFDWDSNDANDLSIHGMTWSSILWTCSIFKSHQLEARLTRCCLQILCTSHSTQWLHLSCCGRNNWASTLQALTLSNEWFVFSSKLKQNQKYSKSINHGSKNVHPSNMAANRSFIKTSKGCFTCTSCISVDNAAPKYGCQ